MIVTIATLNHNVLSDAENQITTNGWTTHNAWQDLKVDHN